jgi:hypothetical protein
MISLLGTLSNGLTCRSCTPYGRVTGQDIIRNRSPTTWCPTPEPMKWWSLGGDFVRDGGKVDVMALVILAWSVVEDEQPSKRELNLIGSI